MIKQEILNSVLDLLADSNFDVNFEAVFKGTTYPTSVTAKQLRDCDDVKELSIELQLPQLHDFEIRLYCDHVIETYDTLPLTWGMNDLIVSMTGNTEVNDEFVNDMQSVIEDLSGLHEYPDISDLSNYYPERQEIFDECLKDYGLFDFRKNVEHFISTLYPTHDVSELAGFENSDWFIELFYNTLEEDFIEGDCFVFNHDFKSNESEIVAEVEKQLGIDFDDCEGVTDDNLVKFGDLDLYKVMGLTDFTLTQLVNVIWLQENESWSRKNLVFMSGYGFYLKANEYTCAVIDKLEQGQVLDGKTLRDTVNQMAKNKVTWWSNWQHVVRTLARIEGLESFSDHYAHGDKYDVVAKDIFQKLVDAHPDMCALYNNWYALKVDTKIIPDKGIRFDRLNRDLSEFTIKFDFAEALNYEIENYPTFVGSLINYAVNKLNDLSEEGE